jgi:hypothetical protein
VACGVTFVATVLAAGDRRARDLTVLLAMLVLASAQLAAGADIFAQRSDTRWSDYVERVRRVTPNDAILVADWAYATPLAYAAFVERSLGKRIVETAHPGDDARRITVWAKDRPVYVIATSEPIIRGVKLGSVSWGDPHVFRVLGRR